MGVVDRSIVRGLARNKMCRACLAAVGGGTLVITVALGGAPAGAAPQAAPGTGQWQVVQAPVPTDRRSGLVDADPLGTSSAWAAGWTALSAGDGDHPRRPLALRLAGNRWVATRIADVDTGGESTAGIATASANDAWMSGNDSNGVVTRRWNGTTWNRVPFGLTADEDGYLQPGRIAAVPGRAWTITTGIFGGYSRGRVAAWNGSAWEWLPDVSETYGDLYDIDAAGRDAVWVAGGSFERGMVLQWDGTRWIDRLPDRADLNLFRIRVVDRDDVWVTGERTGGPEVEAVLLHWDGTRWSETVVPGAAPGGALTATSDGAAWLVGRGDRPDRARYLRYARGGFQAVDGPARPNAFGVGVADLVTVPGQAEPLMVGSASVLGFPAAAAGEARRPAGAVTSPVVTPPVGGGDPVAGAASEWSRVRPPAGIRPLATLNAVAAGGSTRAWAVGQEYAGSYASGIPGVPLVLQLDGTRWARRPLPGITWKGSLTTAAASGPTRAWAAGIDTAGTARLLEFDGAAWRAASLPVTGAVSSLRLVASPGHEPWLFGLSTANSPILLRRNGGTWQSVAAPPAPFTASAVHVAVDGTVWLAGYRLVPVPGSPLSAPVLTVHRWTGTGWAAALPDGPTVFAREILAGPGGELWIAGANARLGPGGPPGAPPSSALVRWDGTAWTQAPLSAFGIPTLSGDDAGRPEWAAGTTSNVNGQLVAGYLKFTGGTWVRVPGAPPVAPELDRAALSGLAHLPGTTSTLAVGAVPYPYEEQRVPRIEREDAP